jgi:ankyrin repeat protein
MILINCINCIVHKFLYHAYLQAGADVNPTKTVTPLVIAATYGLIDCVKYLLKAGADPNIPRSCVSFLLILSSSACNFVSHWYYLGD